MRLELCGRFNLCHSQTKVVNKKLYNFIHYISKINQKSGTQPWTFLSCHIISIVEVERSTIHYVIGNNWRELIKNDDERLLNQTINLLYTCRHL